MRKNYYLSLALAASMILGLKAQAQQVTLESLATSIDELDKELSADIDKLDKELSEDINALDDSLSMVTTELSEDIDDLKTGLTAFNAILITAIDEAIEELDDSLSMVTTELSEDIDELNRDLSADTDELDKRLDSLIAVVTKLSAAPLSTSNPQGENLRTYYPYPNPASQSVSLPFRFVPGNDIISILDNEGRLIESKMVAPSSGSIDLDVSGYKEGIYLYRYNGSSRKFIVVH